MVTTSFASSHITTNIDTIDDKESLEHISPATLSPSQN